MKLYFFGANSSDRFFCFSDIVAGGCTLVAITPGEVKIIRRAVKSAIVGGNVMYHPQSMFHVNRILVISATSVTPEEANPNIFVVNHILTVKIKGI
jgi:hypothetical protein